MTIVTSVAAQDLDRFPTRNRSPRLLGVVQDHARSPHLPHGRGLNHYLDLGPGRQLAETALPRNVKCECLRVDLHPSVLIGLAKEREELAESREERKTGGALETRSLVGGPRVRNVLRALKRRARKSERVRSRVGYEGNVKGRKKSSVIGTETKRLSEVETVREVEMRVRAGEERVVGVPRQTVVVIKNLMQATG